MGPKRLRAALTTRFRQNVLIPKDTKCAPLDVDLVLLGYDKKKLRLLKSVQVHFTHSISIHAFLILKMWLVRYTNILNYHVFIKQSFYSKGF